MHHAFPPSMLYVIKVARGCENVAASITCARGHVRVRVTATVLEAVGAEAARAALARADQSETSIEVDERRKLGHNADS